MLLASAELEIFFASKKLEKGVHEEYEECLALLDKASGELGAVRGKKQEGEERAASCDGTVGVQPT